MIQNNLTFVVKAPPPDPWHGKLARTIRLVLAILILFAVGGFVFIKLDTAAAAEITDKYLRPVFGDRSIVYLEKIFFNISDQATQVVYNFKKPSAPEFFNLPVGQKTIAALELTPITPLAAFERLPGEGVWHAIPFAVFPDKEAMAYSFIRPDPTRSFAFISLVKMDSTALVLGSVAGTVEPGGKVGKYGPGRVPKGVVQSGNLLAAFDGGFQYRDGAYGMIVGDKTYLPLKNDLGTVVGEKDGSVRIFKYEGEDVSNASFVRQNGPLLIENGKIIVTNPDNQKIWGRVVGAGSYTWRSGIGVTDKGDIIFAAGNNLSPATLATALSMAGAANAIQLDINPHWVRFNIFNSTGDGKYESMPLNKNMADGSKEYLNGYQKDFFYVFKR